MTKPTITPTDPRPLIARGWVMHSLLERHYFMRRGDAWTSCYDSQAEAAGAAEWLDQEQQRAIEDRIETRRKLRVYFEEAE